MYFDFFCIRLFCCELWCTPQNNFFRGASGDSLSLVSFSIFCNKNLEKYCSNVVLLYGNWLNELTLFVLPKKILKNMPFFTELTLSPPPPLIITTILLPQQEKRKKVGIVYTIKFLIIDVRVYLYNAGCNIELFHLLAIHQLSAGHAITQKVSHDVPASCDSRR